MRQTTAARGPAIELVAAAADHALPVHLVGREPDGARGGDIAALAAAGGVNAMPGRVVRVVIDGRPALLAGVAGMGLPDAAVLRALAHRVVREAGRGQIALHGLGEVAGKDAAIAGAFLDGLLSAAYRFDRYRTMPRPGDAPERLEYIEIVASGQLEADAVLAAAIRSTLLAVPAQAHARDLVNEAPSTLTPSAFAAIAADVAAEAGLDIEILDEQALEAAGCGGILGIGRGSAQPPRLVMLRTRTPDPVARVALVGKGITFDAGGLFLKRPESMASMKGDMAGAAAILGAISVAAACAPGVEVRAYLALSENLPGERAIKPGDVVRARNGKTIEVNDPDAEGRVVLADALSMASEGAPDVIVDLATLTGSKQEALGTGLAAVFATDDALAARIASAGDRAGEPVWRLPLVEAYRPAMDSAIADLRTFDTTPHCPDAILAALFLREFVTAGTAWAHVDMAGCEFAGRDGDVPEGMATGFGARLLVELLRSFARPA